MKGKPDWQIAVATYGNQLAAGSLWGEFMGCAEDLAARFQWSFTHVDLGVHSGRYAPVGKTYRYSDRALKKLADLAKSSKPTDAGLTWAGPDGNVNVGARLTINLASPKGLRPYWRLVITIEPSALPDEGVVFGDAVRTILGVWDRVFHQRYGLVHAMDREKAPVFYFADAGTRNLVKEEEDELDHWIRSQGRYTEHIRNIYWGNLISPTHGGAHHGELLRALREHLGDDQVMPFGEGRHFITLPFDLADAAHYEENLARWRRRLRRVPVIRDALM